MENMLDKLARTRRQFVLSTTVLAAFSVIVMGFVLYEANIIQFNNDIASEDLRSAVEDHPEVKEYLETEHQNEAHFITIANIIKNDQQESLGQTMLWATIPVVAVAATLGYLVARMLLRPVREAYEAQERFIGDAAHELRNPLATMSAVVQNAGRKKKNTQADFDKYMLQIRRQLGRMVRINEDLLYLERNIDNDNEVEANLSELIMDVIEDMQPHATDRKLSFDLNIEDNVTSDISAKDFVRMARNLVENAIKYSKKSSKKVGVSLSTNKGKVILSVSDQGIGIPEADLESVRERFFRASNVSDMPGSGLGLSIVQKVVEGRGGNFDVQSEENKGTTITVSV